MRKRQKGGGQRGQRQRQFREPWDPFEDKAVCLLTCLLHCPRQAERTTKQRGQCAICVKSVGHILLGGREHTRSTRDDLRMETDGRLRAIAA
jgi:hypothetical protein